MKREDISNGISGINVRYIQEAADYVSEKENKKLFPKLIGKSMIAAVFVLCIIVGGIYLLSSSRSTPITAYAYGTDEQITEKGVHMNTGTISDTGEMKGHPLMFYLEGEDIETVRFSCKNQWLIFKDWTEKRDEYGPAQNFTVSYGEDEKEYYFLVIYWEPVDTIEELTDNEDSKITTLPNEMREDCIVLEITLQNGRTMTKAISVFLQDDGTFMASFDDYKIKKKDTFINRPDEESIPNERATKKLLEKLIKEVVNEGD